MSDVKSATQQVPTFGGNPDEDIDVFLLEFDSTCDAFALDKIPYVDRVEDHTTEERYKLFRLALRKETTKFLVVSEFQGKDEFFMLRNALRNHFSPRENSSVLRVSLCHRKRKPNEFLVKLARELRLLRPRAYPAAHADVVDDIARIAFLDTLDDVMEEKVLDADPASLEAAQRKRTTCTC